MNHASTAVFLAVTLSLLAPADAPKPVIVVVPDGKSVIPAPAPSPAPIPTSAAVSGERFELLTLQNYKGDVAWDVTSPTAFVPPVVIFEKKPGSTATGWRMGATAPAEYQIVDTPTIEVYAVGDGAATVSAWGVTGGKPVKLATFQIVANKGPRPPPPPDPVPVPVPVPVPTPEPDSALVAAFKVALGKDILAVQGTKAKAADLAVVFDSGAALLDLGDPAIAPRTVGDLYSKMFLASVAKGIPRLPYLKETRAVVDANTPQLNGTTVLTPELKAQFQTKYRAIAAALTEASK